VAAVGVDNWLFGYVLELRPLALPASGACLPLLDISIPSLAVLPLLANLLQHVLPRLPPAAAGGCSTWALGTA
jgi:hypothetical protein